MIIPSSSITKAGTNSSSSSSKKFIYSFDEGNKNMKEILGGKGANLAEMTKIDIPVPFGFTITTEVCEYYSKNQNHFFSTSECHHNELHRYKLC